MMFLTKVSSINASRSYKQFRERERFTFKVKCVHNAFFNQHLLLKASTKINLGGFIELKSINLLRHEHNVKSTNLFNICDF